MRKEREKKESSSAEFLRKGRDGWERGGKGDRKRALGKKMKETLERGG